MPPGMSDPLYAHAHIAGSWIQQLDAAERAYVVIVYVVMAYVVMAYVVMADVVMAVCAQL